MGVMCLRKIEGACLVRALSVLIGWRAGGRAGGRAGEGEGRVMRGQRLQRITRTKQVS